MFLKIRFTKSSEAREDTYPQKREMAPTSSNYGSTRQQKRTDSAKK